MIGGAAPINTADLRRAGPRAEAPPLPPRPVCYFIASMSIMSSWPWYLVVSCLKIPSAIKLLPRLLLAGEGLNGRDRLHPSRFVLLGEVGACHGIHALRKRRNCRGPRRQC